MKAKVIKTGEIIEVEHLIDNFYFDKSEFNADYSMFLYEDSDLEFLPDEESICGWICRDKDGDLNLFYNCDKPRREFGEGYWSIPAFGSNFEYLPKNLFSYITWESEPLKVKITITAEK